MGKTKDLYIGKGFSEWGVKGMDARGVEIERLTYPTLPKKTKVHSYKNFCLIEQNGKVIGEKGKNITSCWVEDIEKIAPTIKGSLFGFGPYKNVSVVGVSAIGFKATGTGTVKSANGIDCVFNDKVGVYIHKVDIPKFEKWLKEWGSKFGMKRKGNVLLYTAEWQSFIMNGVFPTVLESTVKNSKVLSLNPKLVMTKSNAQKIYDEMIGQMEAYFSRNLGLTVGVRIG